VLGPNKLEFSQKVTFPVLARSEGWGAKTPVDVLINAVTVGTGNRPGRYHLNGFIIPERGMNCLSKIVDSLEGGYYQQEN